MLLFVGPSGRSLVPLQRIFWSNVGEIQGQGAIKWFHLFPGWPGGKWAGTQGVPLLAASGKLGAAFRGASLGGAVLERHSLDHMTHVLRERRRVNNLSGVRARGVCVEADARSLAYVR